MRKQVAVTARYRTRASSYEQSVALFTRSTLPCHLFCLLKQLRFYCRALTANLLQGPNTLLPQAQAAPWPAMIDNQDSVSPQSVISRPHMNAEVEHQGDSFPQGASSKYQQVAPQHMQSRSSGHRTQLLCSTASHDHQPYPKDTDMQGSHYGQEVYTTAWVVRTGQQLHHAVQHDSPTGDVYQPKSESWYSAQAASRQAHQPLTSALLSEHAHLAYEQEQAQIQHRMERIRLARKQLDLTLKAIEQGSYLAATYQPQGTTHTAGQHHYHGQHDPQHSVQYRGSPTSVSPAAQQLHPQTSMHYGTYTQPLQAEYPSHQQVGFSQAYTSSPHAEGHYAQHAPSSPAYQKKHCVPHISHQGHQSIPAGQHDAYAHPSSGSPQMIVPQHAQRPHPLDFVQIQQSHYPSPLHSKTGQNAGSYSEHASSQHSIIVSHHPSSHVQSDPYGYQAHAQPLGPSGRQPTCHYEDDQHSPNACQYHSPQEFQQAVPAGAGSFLQGTVSPAQSQMAGQQHARSRQGSTQPHTQQQLDPDVVPIYHRPSQRRHKQPPAEQLAYEVQQQVHDASPAQSGQQYQHHMMQRRGSQVRPHHEPDNDGHHQHSMDGAQPFANGQMRAPPQQMLGHHPATLGNTAADTAPHHASVMNGYQSGIESEAAQDGDMSGSDTYAHLPGRRRKLAEVSLRSVKIFVDQCMALVRHLHCCCTCNTVIDSRA